MNSSPHRTVNTQITRIYHALCKLVSNRAQQVDWSSFTPADWEVFPSIAQAEAVAPLVHSILSQPASLSTESSSARLPLDSVFPPAVKSQLAQDYYQNAAYNAMLCRELDRILDALTYASVPAILLKGAAMIKTIYPDPAVRPMNDLDFLVRRANIRPVVRVMRVVGYQRLMDNFIRYHVLMLGGQADNVSVELHWSLVLNAERYPALINWFWSQSQPVDPANLYVLSLSPTAQLLYLAIHLALQHSGQERLSWYYDLYQLVTRFMDRIDWETLLAQAVQVDWAQPLHQALSAAQRRFGFALPDGFLDRLGEQAVRRSAQASLQVGSTADHRSVSVRKAWAGLSLPDRLRMVGEMLFPRPAYLRWRYHPHPAWLWPVYYFQRWGDLMAEGANTIE